MSRPCIAEIDLNAILHNYQIALSASPQSQGIAVVKANAYGHGAIAVSQFLEPHVPAFAVACIEEALAIRQAGVTKPILLLEGCFERDELELAEQNNFWVMVENELQLHFIQQFKGTKLPRLWLKADIGMHRLGFQLSELKKVWQALSCNPKNTHPITIAGHFSCAEALQQQETQQQAATFKSIIKDFPNTQYSAANSAAIINQLLPNLHWIRPGYMLYGGKTLDCPLSNQLRPAMVLKSRVISLRHIAQGESVGYGATWTASRPSLIATVAMGYGDGYPRTMKNGAPALVNGQQAPLVGRVSMDMLTLDVTDLASVNIGDPVVLWGSELTVDQLAPWASTIGYELITRMTGRVKLHYHS